MVVVNDDILRLDAVELRDRLAGGALRAVELAEACLGVVGRREEDVGAWAWLDGDHVMQQARRLDEHRAAGRPIGPLHGLPVGLKDVIDTEGIPTENGTPLDAGRKPSADAYVVKRLKQAGALIMGKTVTTELALRSPGKTRNPHDPAHTPGGSSSGSAAAVAAGMVPLALGTQTVGSVIRPASFCGVVGYKPTFGAIPRSGVLSQAPSLDTLGVFGASIGAAALLADSLFGQDDGDPATALMPSPRLPETAASAPPVNPAFALVRQPAWDTASADVHDGFAELSEALGENCDEVELPPVFAQALQLCELVQLAELSKSYHHYERRGRDKLSGEMQQAIDEGRRILAHDYLAALDWPRLLNDALEAIFSRYDAILTPASPGAAPEGLSSTGSPAFNGIWTFCGTPAVTLPLLQGENGLPVGVQLVGRRGDDGRLLRSAHWLAGFLAEAA
ncbi:amidase [Pelagibius sp. CAU 1746]|uniref:amidase n=1 Tax=Pelagibius sp. CAU 1746 TaxID=3140370 RepID=UPI00325C2868